MMKITGLSHLFKWENLHNWWLTKYFFAPLYVREIKGGTVKKKVKSRRMAAPGRLYLRTLIQASHSGSADLGSGPTRPFNLIHQDLTD